MSRILVFLNRVFKWNVLLVFFRQTRSTVTTDDPFFERHLYVAMFNLLLQLINLFKIIHSEITSNDSLALVSPVVLDELHKSLFDFPLNFYFPELLVKVKEIIVVSKI